MISSSRALRGLAFDFSGERKAVEDGVSVDEEVGLEGGTVEEVSAVGVVDVKGLEGGSVEEVSVVGVVDVFELLVGGWLWTGEVVVVELLFLVGAVDDRVGWVGGSGVETGHCGARREASCFWQLA